MIEEFVREHSPAELSAHTRNPSILRLLGRASGVTDVLRHETPDKIQEVLPHATAADGTFYHIDRYAPDGLYGGDDPALRTYNGLPLVEQYNLLNNPNNALAVLVSLNGDIRHE